MIDREEPRQQLVLRFPIFTLCTSFERCDITFSKSPRRAYVPTSLHVDFITIYDVVTAQ